MVIETIPNDILAIGALLATTFFLLWGRKARILLIEMFAFIMAFIVSIWAFTVVIWYIPFIFVIGSGLVFILDVAKPARRRGV
jgi:hypothetical protein